MHAHASGGICQLRLTGVQLLVFVVLFTFTKVSVIFSTSSVRQ